MAGTYYRPGRVIDTSISDLTKGVQDVEKALKEEAKLRKIEEQNRINRINKINEGEYGLSSAINEFPEYADVTLDDEIKLGLKNQLEYVHQLGIDSIGKDNSAYLQAKRQLEVAAKEAGLFMASFNEQGALWEERRYVNEDQPSSYLNNTDPGRVAFMDDYVKGGSNIKPELVDGVWMFTKKGEDGGEDFIVNSRAYLNEENDFIEYTEDIAPIAKTIYDTHAVKYQKEKEKILEKYEGGNGAIITETFEDWDKANIDLRKAINSDPALLKTLNSKTFQSIPLEIRGKQSYDPSSQEQKTMYMKYIEDKIMADFAEEGRTRTALSTDRKRKSSGNSYDKATTSQLAALGGVFGELDATVNEAFEMSQGDRVKTVTASINNSLPESANYAYLDFTQVKTQIEKERKKAVEAGNSEEVARLDELKKEYKLDQAPNKDLIYKKTFTKGKIQLDKPFDSSDKDKVLRTLAKERGITSEEAFEVFKSQRTNVEDKNTFDPQNFQNTNNTKEEVKTKEEVENNKNIPASSNSNTGAGVLNTSQGSGSVTSVQQPVVKTPVGNVKASVNNVQTTSPSNEYGDNVKIDPQGKPVSFNFNGKEVESKKSAANHPVLKMKNDGNDYKRKIANFETLAGSSTGGGVTGYGFSGANSKLADKYKNAKGKTNEEKFINTVDEYIIGKVNTPGKNVYGEDLSGITGKTDVSILTDLNMKRATFDALPEDVKKELVDWKMNSGRNAADIVVIASGGVWDGTKGARKSLPGDALSKVDYKKIDGKKLIKARRAMYKGTLDLYKEKYGEKSGEYIRAKAQYDNSQQYR